MTYEKKNLTTYESMYESPLSLQMSEICNEISKCINDDVDTAVMRSIKDIGINVDKEELIKALQYDRDQYNKGYSDGVRFGFEAGKPKWIPVSEELPEKNIACLVAVGKLNLTQMAMYSDLMGTIDHKIFYQGDYGHDNFSNITEYVKAWMPLPATYEPQESEE